MRTLFLTSPHMHGDDVRRLQRALNTSKYGDFLRGAAVDGDFGLYTHQSVFRAKYWLGYAEPNHAAALPLVEYLEGRKDLPGDMKERRRQRLAKPGSELPVRMQALNAIETYLGIHGTPNEITRWWGWSGPWCAMTVSRAYVQAGSSAFKRGVRWANVGQIVDAARAGAYGLSLTREPLPGDLVIFRFPGCSTRFSHVGMVYEANRDHLLTIEGNTSAEKSGSQDNGGLCCRKDRTDERRAGWVVLYVHASR